MRRDKPVYIGKYPPVYAGDIVDYFADITNDLESGEEISSVAFEVLDEDDNVVANVVTANTETTVRTTFRTEAPDDPGNYRIFITFTIDDGQELTRWADYVVLGPETS